VVNQLLADASLKGDDIQLGSGKTRPAKLVASRLQYAFDTIFSGGVVAGSLHFFIPAKVERDCSRFY
jgi:hypothetical protein